MKVKKVSKNEFDELMNLMNTSFNMEGDGVFQHILPKLYFKENDTMIHYGAYEDDKLVASIGLYPMTLVSKYGKLNVACVGAVSTHPNYRLKGYFKVLMKKIVSHAKKNNYDLLFLGGNRVRYGRFGFENAGRILTVCISKRTRSTLKPIQYEVKLIKENDVDIIAQCLKLYNKQPQHVLRTLNDFYKHIITWNGIPYAVLVDGKVVGYYSIKENIIAQEFVYKKGYKDTVLDSCLSNRNECHVQVSMDEYNSDLLRKVDWFRIEHDEMYLVFNWENVAKYMNFSKDYKEQMSKLTNKEKIRCGLGNDAFDSMFTKGSIFIFPCDHA